MRYLWTTIKLMGVIAGVVLALGTMDALNAQREMDAEKTAIYKNLLEQKRQAEPKKFDDSGAAAKDAAYWYDRGTLLSVYGNTNAAIVAFKKAVELEPANSNALFQLGVEYGTAGRYQDALATIDKAIAINPGKAVFYYGRGWVFLLSGDTDKAVQDFKIAAQQGNQNAIDYLRRHVPEPQ